MEKIANNLKKNCTFAFRIELSGSSSVGRA